MHALRTHGWVRKVLFKGLKMKFIFSIAVVLLMCGFATAGDCADGKCGSQIKRESSRKVEVTRKVQGLKIFKRTSIERGRLLRIQR